jgi:hypothetical protein
MSSSGRYCHASGSQFPGEARSSAQMCSHYHAGKRIRVTLTESNPDLYDKLVPTNAPAFTDAVRSDESSAMRSN